MNRVLLSCVGLCWCFVCSVPNAHAVTVLSVGGTANGFDTFFQTDVFGFSFTLGQDLTNVGISVGVDCLNCSGSVFLTDHLSEPSELGLEAALGFTDFPGSSANQSLFSGLDLVAETYFVTFQLNPGSSQLAWFTANPSVETNRFGAIHNFDFQAGLPDATFAPHSSGINVLNQGGGFLFTITGEPLDMTPPHPVPLPSALVLFASALGLMGFRKRGGRPS